jgi:hypothetical protein
LDLSTLNYAQKTDIETEKVLRVILNPAVELEIYR